MVIAYLPDRRFRRVEMPRRVADEPLLNRPPERYPKVRGNDGQHSRQSTGIHPGTIGRAGCRRHCRTGRNWPRALVNRQSCLDEHFDSEISGE